MYSIGGAINSKSGKTRHTKYFDSYCGTPKLSHTHSLSFITKEITQVSFKTVRPDHSIRFIASHKNICILRHVIIFLGV